MLLKSSESKSSFDKGILKTMIHVNLLTICRFVSLAIDFVGTPAREIDGLNQNV